MVTKIKSKKAKAKKAVKQTSKKAVHKVSSHTSKPATPKKKPLKESGQTQEFLYIPVNSITVMEQVRSNINTESDSFKALMQSIKDRGILEPLLVTWNDGAGYTLLCGERRLVAARQLGLETVPARIVTTATEQDEVIAFQLTENLQREDLNPIDQANGVPAYIQTKHPDKGYDVDGVMNELVVYERRPEDLFEEIRETVSRISEISGKTIRTLYNGLSLLNNPDAIQVAVSDGTLPVSQGYIFAANLDCPDRDKIFQGIMKTPVTNATLTNMLTAWKKPKPDAGDPKIIPMTKQVVYLRTTRSFMEMGKWQYNKPDLRIFLDELRSLCALVEQNIPNAPEPEPDKKKPNNKPQV